MTGTKEITLKGYSIWNDVMKSNKITDIQDPVLEMEIDKHEFANMYENIVSELQGKGDIKSYIDYYFIVNPIKSFSLIFRSEKEKNAFYDIGLNKNCVISLTEVCEGETKKDKKKRNKKNKKIEENDDDYIIVFE